MNKKISVITILIFLFAVGGYFIVHNNNIQTLKDKIATECSTGGKIITEECGRLLAEYRKYTGPIEVNQSELSTQPSTTISQEDTSNWKTYTNTQYGFELKYPPAWDVFEAWPQIVIEDSQGGKLSPGKNVYLWFDVSAHSSPAIDEKPITKTFGTKVGYVYEKAQVVYFPFSDRAGAYIIQLEPRDHPNETNQILSTFKFTK